MKLSQTQRQVIKDAWSAYMARPFNAPWRIAICKEWGGEGPLYLREFTGESWSNDELVSLEPPRWYDGEPKPKRWTLKQTEVQVAAAIADAQEEAHLWDEAAF